MSLWNHLAAWVERAEDFGPERQEVILSIAQRYSIVLKVDGERYVMGRAGMWLVPWPGLGWPALELRPPLEVKRELEPIVEGPLAQSPPSHWLCVCVSSRTPDSDSHWLTRWPVVH